MTFFKTSLILLSIFLISCCSTTKTTGEDQGNTKINDAKMNIEKMITDGFKMGEVVYSDLEGDCEYTIRILLEEEMYLFDPINLSEEFKKNGEKVWVKYGGLRMKNRCDKANPISIVEIQKRVE